MFFIISLEKILLLISSQKIIKQFQSGMARATLVFLNH